MDRTSRLKTAARSSSEPQSSSSSTSKKVVTLECTNEPATAEDWKYGMLPQAGDIVEELRIGDNKIQAPFKHGKSGVQKFLHKAFVKNRDDTVVVRIRYGLMPNNVAVVPTCLVPMEDADSDCSSERKVLYTLRPLTARPNSYTLHFVDRTLGECYELQASRRSRTTHRASSEAQPQDRSGANPWDPYVTFLSILFLPCCRSGMEISYNDLEDTMARANLWISASRESGVPIRSFNVQTESLLTEISEDPVTNNIHIWMLDDLPDLFRLSSYLVLDRQRLGVGLVRAVRLWYLPDVRELRFHLVIKEEDTELGFALNRSDEGFMYISSRVEGHEDVPFVRSGLFGLYKDAVGASRLLVISRIEGRKVLPFMVTSTGTIRAFETTNLWQSMCVHFQQRHPITIDVFMWNRESSSQFQQNG